MSMRCIKRRIGNTVALTESYGPYTACNIYNKDAIISVEQMVYGPGSIIDGWWFCIYRSLNNMDSFQIVGVDDV